MGGGGEAGTRVGENPNLKQKKQLFFCFWSFLRGAGVGGLELVNYFTMNSNLR